MQINWHVCSAAPRYTLDVQHEATFTHDASFNNGTNRCITRFECSPRHLYNPKPRKKTAMRAPSTLTHCRCDGHLYIPSTTRRARQVEENKSRNTSSVRMPSLDFIPERSIRSPAQSRWMRVFSDELSTSFRSKLCVVPQLTVVPRRVIPATMPFPTRTFSRVPFILLGT